VTGLERSHLAFAGRPTNGDPSKRTEARPGCCPPPLSPYGCAAIPGAVLTRTLDRINRIDPARYRDPSERIAARATRGVAASTPDMQPIPRAPRHWLDDPRLPDRDGAVERKHRRRFPAEPWQAPILASTTIAGIEGRPDIRLQVKTNRPQTRWWFVVTYGPDHVFMADYDSTTSRRRASEWIAALIEHEHAATQARHSPMS
jgi:hypothetical protein